MITNLEVAAQGPVKEGGLGADDGTVGLELTPTAANRHVGKLFAVQQSRQGRVNRRGAERVYPIVLFIPILVSGGRGSP